MRLNRYITEKKGFFDEYPDYIIKENKPHQYVISKWTKDKAPDQVYTITEKSNKFSCTCPGNSAKKVECVHIKMLKDWIKAGKPSAIGSNFDTEWKHFLSK